MKRLFGGFDLVLWELFFKGGFDWHSVARLNGLPQDSAGRCKFFRWVMIMKRTDRDRGHRAEAVLAVSGGILLMKPILSFSSRKNLNACARKYFLDKMSMVFEFRPSMEVGSAFHKLMELGVTSNNTLADFTQWSINRLETIPADSESAADTRKSRA